MTKATCEVARVIPYPNSDTSLVMIHGPMVYNCKTQLLIDAGILTSVGGPKSDILPITCEIEVGKSKLWADIITSIRIKQ